MQLSKNVDRCASIRRFPLEKDVESPELEGL
jgi:hypothetical protein